MLRIGLLLALGMQQQPTVDSLGVYSAILEQVRAEFPARAVALANTRSGVDCMPLCGVHLRDPGNGAAEAVASPPPDANHSAALLDSLRARGVIQDACAVQEGWYGCPEFPEHLFVALGDITSQPTRGPEPVTEGVWVKVALLVPCTGDCTARRASEHYHPETFGYWYLLRQGADGTWVIIRRAPGFTA